MTPCFEQGILGQRAGSHQPHHIPFHHGFGAAFLGLGRAFQLFAYRDAEPLADQGQQIPFGGMHGNAAHGNILAVVFATFGQGDVQRLCGIDRVVKEHLVEIAHPIKKQRIGMRCFDLKILRHHGRNGHASSPGVICPTFTMRTVQGKPDYPDLQSVAQALAGRS